MGGQAPTGKQDHVFFLYFHPVKSGTRLVDCQMGSSGNLSISALQENEACVAWRRQGGLSRWSLGGSSRGRKNNNLFSVFTSQPRG